MTLANLPEPFSWGGMMENEGRGASETTRGAWGGAWEESRVTKTPPPHTHTHDWVCETKGGDKALAEELHCAFSI